MNARKFGRLAHRPAASYSAELSPSAAGCSAGAGSGAGGAGGSLAGQPAWASVPGTRIPLPPHQGQVTVVGGPPEARDHAAGAAAGHTLARPMGPLRPILRVLAVACHEAITLAFPR